MRLHLDPNLFEQVFGKPLLPPNLPLVGDRLLAITQIIETLEQAAETCFNINLQTQPLTTSEWRNILTQIE
jgi:hypothetical protein